MMTGTSSPLLDGVLTSLQDVKSSGNGHWQARCPAHDDRRPSLSITTGDDGRILLKCHAGCGLKEIVDAIGLRVQDLYPAGTDQNFTSGRIVETYDYTDEHGAVIYQAVRFEPKDFRQRRPDGKGGYHWNLKGVKRVLYRLPELLKAAPEEPIYVVEGEKDVDRLGKCGLVATTCSGGAAKWRQSDDSVLVGRHVVIIPDNDKAGYAHTEQVAASLAGRAAEIRVVELPDLLAKGDVSDWLDGGGTTETLKKLVQETPLYDPKSSQKPIRQESGGPYEATDEGLIWYKKTKEGPVPVQLTNFTAIIVTDVLEDDGVERPHVFEIEARLNNVTRRFSIPASQFNGMGWVVDNLGAAALVYPGFSQKDHARAAIQILSRQPATQTHYRHTGWRQVDGEWVYLHGGGAIGTVGTLRNICIDLENSLRHYQLSDPPEGDTLRKAIKADLKLLDLAPHHIMVSALAAVYRAALGPADFAVHIAGDTGTFKTELAALLQQHFGHEMDARNLPGSWSSTANSLEMAAFTAKDTIFVIDDFAPGGTVYDVQRLHKEADRIIRAQGNHSGRGRLRPDGSLKQSKPPRGLIISTGEDIPRGKSLRARLLVIELKSGDILADELSKCQAESHLYPQVMAGYLRWIAQHYDQVQEWLKATRHQYRLAAAQSDQHRRTPSIIAELFMGAFVFLRFAEQVGAISNKNREQLLERFWNALGDIASAQQAHQQASDPVTQYLTLLNSAVASGAAHIAHMDGSLPPGPVGWGWRKREVGNAEEWQPQGTRVGWIDVDDLYLDPPASYAAAQKMAQATGESIAVTAATLRRRLKEREILATTDTKRSRLVVRRTIEEQRRDVLHLKVEALIECSATPQPSHSQEKPDTDSENGSLRQKPWDGLDIPGLKPAHESVPSEGVADDGTVGTVSQQHPTTSPGSNEGETEWRS